MDRLFLVIGGGSIGKRHMRNLLSLGQKVIALDTREDRCTEAREKLGIAAYSDPAEAWARKPAAVFVTTPTSHHLAPALEAAERGCPLFIEKPLAHETNGLDALLAEVEARGLVTLVGCNLRFHPGLRKAKELLESGAIGRVLAVRAEVGQYLPDWHPWEDYRQGYSANARLGGGVILDDIHELDYVRWLGGEVEEVTGYALRTGCLEIDTEDMASLLLRFRGGAVGEVHMDYIQRVYSRTCHVIGLEGTLRWDVAEGVRLWRKAEGRWEGFPLPAGWSPNDMYLDELRHFLGCLDGKERPCQDVFEAKRILEVALAAKRSSAEGRAVRLGTGGRA